MIRFKDYIVLKVHDLLERGLHGQCDFERKTILVGNHLKGKKELEVLIHEILHANDPESKEKKVDTDAKEISETLWKWGYRKRSSSHKG